MLLGAQVLLHLGVALVLLKLARRFELVASALVSLIGLHRLAQRVLLAGKLRHPSVVSGDLGSRHLGLDLVVAANDPFESVDQAAAPAVSSSPSRALLKAVIATSSMSSDGSRVVNFWVPRTGSKRTLITGFVRCRAM